MTSHKSSLRRRLRALLLLPVMAVMAGCYQMDMDFTINSDDTVDFTLEFVDSEGLMATEGITCQEFQEMFDASAPADFDGEYNVEDFESDGNMGCRMTLTGAPLDDMAGGDGMGIRREGDLYIFELEGDPSADMGDLGGLGFNEPEVSISVTFPGSVVDAGSGQVSGNTVTWTGVETLVQGARATGEADDGGSSTLLIVGIVVGIVVIGAVVAIIVVSSRKKSGDQPGAAPYGGAPQGYGPQDPQAAPQGYEAPQGYAPQDPNAPAQGYGTPPSQPQPPQGYSPPQPPSAGSADQGGPPSDPQYPPR